MIRMAARIDRGILTLVKESPLKGFLKRSVDDRIAGLRKDGGHKKILAVYERLKKTGRIRVIALRARVMASPQFFGTSLVDLRRGADVKVLARKGSWVKVSYGQRVGWMHKNRLFPKVIRLGTGETGSGTTQGEAELSGRG